MVYLLTYSQTSMRGADVCKRKATVNCFALKPATGNEVSEGSRRRKS